MSAVQVIVVSLMSALLGGGIVWGGFVLREQPVQDPYGEAIAACFSRGGSWVYNAELPLCMTPNEGLLQFVDEEKDDPWTKGFTPLFMGEELAQSERGIEGQELLDDVRYGGDKEAETCTERTTEAYTGKIAEVDFSSWPDASTYKTAITKDVARGVNFAGSYVVSTWGCAKNRRAPACVGHAVVNARTGEIVLYDVIGRRTGEFSVDSNMFSVTLQSGEEKVWSIEGDMSVDCL